MPLASRAEDRPVVDLSYIVDHPAIEATKLGILEVLAENGFAPETSMRLEVQSAQGNMATQAQIAKKFVGDAPKLIIAISTPTAQAMAAATKSIPVVFAAVTDPQAAGLVDSYEKPGRNLTGSSDKTPIDKHLALILKFLPSAKRIGVLYNAGEANSVAQVTVVKEEAAKLGLTVVEATATQSGAVLDAARSLVGKADAIYVPTDSTIVSAVEAVVRVGSDAKLPVFAADTDSVGRGAVAALGFNYKDIGRAAGQSAVQILEGADPAAIPVRFLDKLDLYVNVASARRMGVEVPKDVLASAAKIIP
jgi:putative ABC transport system substrate-binding protein